MADAALLEARAVSKSYGAVRVVQQVSFGLRAGEICGCLGPNGSGKTTTVRMLTGLLTPSLGAIYFRGQPITDDLEEYKRHIGYVPEEPHLYRYLSGAEYLDLIGGLRGLAARPRRERVAAALAALGLTQDRDLPMDAYSKGMKQKILIAAAMLHAPDVLILDEPLSGLDVTAVLLVRHVFAAFARRGCLVLHSSHVLEVVEKVCTRVIVLYRGRVAADDSVGNLRTLMRLPTLERIFAQLTEQEDLEDRAERFVAAMADG